MNDGLTLHDAGPSAEAVCVCLGDNANLDECRQMLEIITDALEHGPAVS